MKIPTAILTAGLIAALVLPAAAEATAARQTAHHGVPADMSFSTQGRTLRPAIGATSAVPVTKTRPVATSRAGVKPKPRSKPASGQGPVMTILPFFWTTTTESGPADLDNCASYTGCTDEEYCQVWGLKCDLVQPTLNVPRRDAGEKDAA